MRKYLESVATIFYIGSGLFFLVSTGREVFNLGLYTEWVMSMAVLLGLIASLSLRLAWIAYFYFILLLFYNPIILGQFNAYDTMIADILVGVSFFFTGLHWKKFTNTIY